MADTGDGTTGSQFLLIFGDTELPGTNTLVGHISAGMDVLDRIADAGIRVMRHPKSGLPITDDGQPRLDVTIRTARATRG